MMTELILVLSQVCQTHHYNVCLHTTRSSITGVNLPRMSFMAISEITTIPVWSTNRLNEIGMEHILDQVVSPLVDVETLEYLSISLGPKPGHQCWLIAVL
jgi:hypothetical protein